MAAVTLDLIDGHHAELTKDGWEIDRIAIVSGVTGDGHSKVLLASAVAGMPTIGSPYPGRTICKCVRKTLDAVTSEEVRFRLTYSDRGVSEFGSSTETLQGDCSLMQTETNVDRNGNLMPLYYTYPDTYPFSDKLSHKTEEERTHHYNAEAVFLAPQLTLSLSKVLTYNPASIARDYVGTVNAGGWAGDFAAPAGYWMCTRISWTSKDQGTTFDTVFSFAYNPKSWIVRLAYVNRHTGQHPGDLATNPSAPYSILNAELYQIKNFNAIGL